MVFSPYLVKHRICQFVHNTSVFGFGFETRIKLISPVISNLINEAQMIADQVSLRYCFISLTSLTGFW